MKTPSVADILAKHGFGYEAEKVRELVTAADALPSIKRKS